MNRETFERRRVMWRAYRERGELPDLDPLRLAERRRRSRYWWVADSFEDEGPPDRRHAASPVAAGPVSPLRPKHYGNHSILQSEAA